MPERPRHEWNDAFDASQHDELVAALQANGGIIAHAAGDIGLTRQHMTKLLRSHGLMEFARGLRVANGSAPSGLGRQPGT